VTFLVDTNVVSELRKGDRADPGVLAWMGTKGDDLFLSVLVIGELRRGVEQVRRRDPRSAGHLEAWLDELLIGYAGRILPVSLDVAEVWGRLGVPDPVPPIDGLLAATALVHDLTLVTRNVADVAVTGVALLNPFTDG
jgi:predicted nucleic acid-binding protein